MDTKTTFGATMTMASARGGEKPASARISARGVDSARNNVPQTYAQKAKLCRMVPLSLILVFPSYHRETGRDTLRSLMDTGRGEGVLESSRPTMSTARVQTALAALAAEKQLLLSKLAMVDSELEQKRVKVVRKMFQS